MLFGKDLFDVSNRGRIMRAVFVVEYVNRYHRSGLETQAPNVFPLLRTLKRQREMIGAL